MSNLNEMINAAREGNPAKFKEIFEEEIGSRIGDALQEAKADMVAEMFGVTQNDLTLDEIVETLTDDELDNLNEAIEEFDLDVESLSESDIRRYAKMGAKVLGAANATTGAVGGAIAGGMKYGVGGAIAGGIAGGAIGGAAGAVGGGATGAAAGAVRKGVRGAANVVRRVAGKPTSKSPSHKTV